MTHTNTHLSDQEARAVLATWRLKPIFMRPAGGTANASLTIVGARGQYILRRRNPRYTDPGQLAYDHAVIHGLAKAGLPVPRIVRSPSGSRWVEREGRIYELFEFIEGVPAEPEHPGETCEAGAMLAKLHLATERLKPAGKKDWPRYFDPKVSLKVLRETKGRLERGSPEPQGDPRDTTEASRGRACPHARKAGGPSGRGRGATPARADGSAPDRGRGDTPAHATVDFLLKQAQLAERELPDKAYWALPLSIVHGDWHPANLRFRDHRIVGVFDFDWVGRQPRMVDVTDGLLFFGSRRETALDGGDIWSLTQPFEPVWELMALFMEAYRQQVPLTEAELQALPALMRQRCLYNRVDAMVRKVAPPDQVRFLVTGIRPVFEWITAHEAQLRVGW